MSPSTTLAHSPSMVNTDDINDTEDLWFPPTTTTTTTSTSQAATGSVVVENHGFGLSETSILYEEGKEEKQELDADDDFQEFLPLMMKLYDVKEKNNDNKDEVRTTAANTDQQKLNTWNTTSSLSLPLWHITKVDLPHCDLDELPNCLPKALPNLKVLFLSNNRFSVLPSIIGQCPNLSMVAFKSNGMLEIHPDALQSQLRWLILTDNNLTQLPKTVGRCQKLQKLMLSGNALTELPIELAECRNLELIRLASNRLEYAPMHVLQQLPKLAWIGLSDNPFLNPINSLDVVVVPPLPVLDITQEEEEAGEILGRGAGGIVRKFWLAAREEKEPEEVSETQSNSSNNLMGSYVAVKTFSGAMTSDGLADQERILSCAVSNTNCKAFVKVLGETCEKQSLVLEYLDRYQALACPPSLSTCSRDVYDHDSKNDSSIARLFSEPALLLSMVSTLLDALVQLHRAGIVHGDFYAHNILVSHDSTTVKLTDFGAATFYDKKAKYGQLVEHIELRAFIILLEELLEHHTLATKEEETPAQVSVASQLLYELVQVCRDAAEFETPLVWWKQRMLQDLARSLEYELDL